MRRAHSSAETWTNSVRSITRVAVLCVPRQSAMDLAGELVGQGIKGFWNFSHYDLSVEYPDVSGECPLGRQPDEPWIPAENQESDISIKDRLVGAACAALTTG